MLYYLTDDNYKDYTEHMDYDPDTDFGDPDNCEPDYDPDEDYQDPDFEEDEEDDTDGDDPHTLTSAIKKIDPTLMWANLFPSLYKKRKSNESI